MELHLFWEAKLAGEQSIQWVSLTGVANLSFPCSCASVVGPWYSSTSHVGLDSNIMSDHKIIHVVVPQMTDALKTLMKMAIVHFDIKLENILITANER